MSGDLPTILMSLATRKGLSRRQAEAAFEQIMSGSATEPQIAALLMGLAVKGVSLDELVGAAIVMRQRAVPIDCDSGSGVVLDTCGTGGDVKGTFNISTVAAIIAAAAGGSGMRVVKHGNRSASGNSGSADVLERLGVNLNQTPQQMARGLTRSNLCFAFARNHHPAMQHVAAVRKSLGFPTIFNLLGPLTNPARARHQLIGVFAPQWTEILATALRELGSERAWVVHADDGLDELSTMSPTRISELRDGVVTTWRFDPASLGISPPRLADLQVRSIDEAAAALMEVLNGTPGARRDIAVLNAAAALVVAGTVNDLKSGITQAERAIDSGGGRQVLEKLICSAE